MKLYPLKFLPKYYYRIWGGNKLREKLNKNYKGDSIGESWEISDIKNSETTVANGAFKGKTLKELLAVYKEDIVGTKNYKIFGNDFPLLIKFIDAKKPLSIQVHPSDDLAKKRHDSFGKNEMWYVMEADKNAELIVGFNKQIDEKEYVKHLNNLTLNEILNIEKVQKGDTFNIPTGRVHAIGAGVLLAEIQQTSNVTYRIFDYDRLDVITGNKRELHTDLALEAIDYKYHDNYKVSYNKKENNTSLLVHTKYFKTNIIDISGKIEKNYSNLDSFVIYMCVKGVMSIEYQKMSYILNYGETILIPANIDHLKLVGEKVTVLEVYL